MTVSVQEGSARIVVSTRPNATNPTINGANAAFNCTNIRATGAATLTGDAGDDPTAWMLGFIQAQWIETNWAYYRGAGNEDGSLFIQRARPPARPRQPCRDCVGPASDVFYSLNPAHGEIASGGAGVAFPLPLAVSHYDKPGDFYALSRQNTLTGKPNYLYEAQLEFNFCAILSLRGPGPVFRHLSHFYWNVNWQATFRRSPAGAFSVNVGARGVTANVGGPYAGAPDDIRFSRVLTSAQTQNCNMVAAAETTNAGVRQSRRWEDFDVTK